MAGEYLTIEGEAEAAEESKERDYLIHERRHGAVRRAVRLPKGVDVDHAGAEFHDGVLTLTFPRLEEAKAKTIKVLSAEAEKGEGKGKGKSK